MHDNSKRRRRQKHPKRKKLFGLTLIFCVIVIFAFAFVRLRVPLAISQAFSRVSLPMQGVEPTPIPANSLKLLKDTLDKSHVSFTEITSNGTVATVKLSESGEALIPLNKSLIEQVSSLQLILSRIRIEGKKVGRIDFRFDKAIVTFE